MLYQIKNRYDDRVQFELECDSLKECVVAAAKSGTNLSGANLSGADLRYTNLSGADLRGADLSYTNLSEKFGKLNANGMTYNICPAKIEIYDGTILEGLLLNAHTGEQR